MASFFGHAVLGFALARISSKKELLKTSVLCILCAVIPDIDFICHKAGVPYDSTFGHRGFTHSIVFAIGLALLFRYLFFRQEKLNSSNGLTLFVLFFICTLSHGLLDSLTNGGLGVAYFSPFSNERYFFPWTPIKVSPLGIGKFFSERGLRVIKSEAIWIGIPSLVVVLVKIGIEKIKNRIPE